MLGQRAQRVRAAPRRRSRTRSRRADSDPRPGPAFRLSSSSTPRRAARGAAPTANAVMVVVGELERIVAAPRRRSGAGTGPRRAGAAPVHSNWRSPSGERRRVQLGQHLGEPQRARGRGVPRVGRRGRDRTRRARTAGRGSPASTLSETRRRRRSRPRRAGRARTPGAPRAARRAPSPTARRTRGPAQSASSRVRAAPVGAGRRAVPGQRQAQLLAQHLKRGELRDEVGVDRPAVEQAEHRCRCRPARRSDSGRSGPLQQRATAG